MNLRAIILAEHSKENCNRVVQWVGESQSRFDKLVSLFLHDEPIVIQRAAWPLSYIAETHPSLIKKHTGTLVHNLRKRNLHDAVKRNTLRIFRDIDIPERYHGEIMDTCFRYTLSPSEKPAVKAFSLAILRKLSTIYPEIKAEIITIIESKWDMESAAFRSQAKHFLND